MGMRYERHSKRVLRSRRWQALRMEILERDGFRCVSCGARGRLEVDHVTPVRDAPERAFDRDNLQSLCPGCHARKTRVEVGHPELPPARRAWRDLIAGMATPPSKQEIV